MSGLCIAGVSTRSHLVAVFRLQRMFNGVNMEIPRGYRSEFVWPFEASQITTSRDHLNQIGARLNFALFKRGKCAEKFNPI